VNKGLEKFDIALQKLDEDDAAYELIINKELDEESKFNYNKVYPSYILIPI
jgi:hypothetical protein